MKIVKKNQLKPIILIFIFCLLIYFRGGYFYYEAYLFSILGLVMIIANIKDLRIINKRDFLPLLIFYFAFFFVGFYAVDKGMHLLGGLKIISPFIFFLGLIQYEDSKDDLIKYIFFAITLMAFLGLILSSPLTRLASLQIRETIISGRYGGFYQYANTNAILSGLALGYYINSLSNVKGVFSRNNLYKLFAILILFVSLIYSQSISVILISLIGIFYIVTKKKWGYKSLLIACLIFIIFLVAYILLGGSQAYLFTKKSSLLTRFIYYKDGLLMLMNNLWGYGHLGYYRLQTYFQTGSAYRVKYIHNFFIQIFLDGGLLAFLSIAYLLYRGVKTRLEAGERGCLILLLILLAHSQLDFEFEFSLVWLLLFFLLGLERDTYKLAHRKTSLVIFSSFLLVFVYFFNVSYMAYIGQGGRALKCYPFYNQIEVDNLLADKIEDEEKYQIANNLLAKGRFIEAFDFLSKYYYNIEKYDLALLYAYLYYEAYPLSDRARENLAKNQKEYIRLALEEKDTYNKALEQIHKMLDWPYTLRDLEKKRGTPYHIKNKASFKMTKKHQQYYREVLDIYKRKFLN